MILIADSGSTKTHWCLVNGTNKAFYYTSGINPYFKNSLEIKDSIEKELLNNFKPEDIRSIFFYGSGCGTNQNCLLVKETLEKLFTHAKAEVFSDLLGAARGACGKQEGIAAIIGTGSNSCYFDGNEIIENMPSLGYILGDEGSGAYIGKKLIQDFLYKEFPIELEKSFNEDFSLDRNLILEAVYKKEYPNRFLASFTKFLSKHIDHSYVNRVLEEAFDAFLTKHICKYRRHKEVSMSCVGSIAFHFNTQLSHSAAKKGINIKRILESPMEGLIEYHTS